MSMPTCLSHPTTAPANVNRHDGANALEVELRTLIRQRRLHALLQPIADLRDGAIIGYEGLIRGPHDSPLHLPGALFAVARNAGLTPALEHLCRRVVLERYAALDLPGKLFLNISPESLLQDGPADDDTVDYLAGIGLLPARVVLELTENQPTLDYARTRAAMLRYRAQGFQIALDDLGEGFSSLRLWSELRPDYVKIDMHFIQGINRDPVKLQFVRSIMHIAEQSATLLIAEGIETDAELLVLRDLGVAYGQGYRLGRPVATPPHMLPDEMLDTLGGRGIAVYPRHGGADKQGTTIAKLLQTVTSVDPATHNNDVYDMFHAAPQLQTLPVVEDGVPLGLISRYDMIEHFARPYQRELHGKKSCRLFMDAGALIADKDTTLQQLSMRMAAAAAQQLSNGFIITEQGRYLGMGTGHDLMREITQLQITAARYANPLTQLPGNVPINEHIDRLIGGGSRFLVCYCDLDHFKPFNDVYGYRKGDDVIALAGDVLCRHVDADRDFVGHIGGDDFMLLLQSDDGASRCQAILDEFAQRVLLCFGATECAAGGYLSEDRQGNKVFFPLVSMSIGVVRAEPGQYHSHHQIATAAADAKKQAKKIAGNSLFLDRRRPA